MLESCFPFPPPVFDQLARTPGAPLIPRPYGRPGDGGGPPTQVGVGRLVLLASFTPEVCGTPGSRW